MADLELKKTMLTQFYHSITSFADTLCISKHEHYVIDKYLHLCIQYEMINILIVFVRDIICPHLNDLMKHALCFL